MFKVENGDGEYEGFFKIVDQMGKIFGWFADKSTALKKAADMNFQRNRTDDK